MTPEELQKQIDASVAQSQQLIQNLVQQQQSNIAAGNPILPNGVTPSSINNPLYPDIAQYQNMLGGDPQHFMQMLISMLQDKNNMQINDQQWALLNSLLDWQKEQNTRGYNEGLRDEQRSYDSPTQLLSRLMQTGMSREAALQAIAGSAAGGGSSAPYAGSPAASQLGLSPSESTLNEVNTKMGIANSVLGSLSGLASLAFTGLSLPQVISQNAITKNAALASDMQNAALSSVGNFTKALYARNDKGQYLSAPSQEQAASLEGLMSFAGGVSADVNPALHEFMNSAEYSSMMQNPFAASLLASQFSAMSNAQRNKLDDDILAQSRLLQLQERLGSINVEKALLDYKWDTSKFNDYKLSEDVINAYNIMSFKDKLDLLCAARTPEQLQYRISKLENDNEFNAVRSALMLQKEYLLQGAMNTEQGKDVLQMCYFLEQCGFTGPVGNVIQAIGGATGLITGNFKDAMNKFGQVENSRPKLPMFNPSALFGTWKDKLSSVLPKLEPKTPDIGDFLTNKETWR